MSRTPIVEDESRIVALLTKGFKAAGFTMHTAAEGEQAVALVVQEDSDLIILDAGLPDIDGFEVLQQLCSQGMGMPVIMFMTRSSVADRVAGLEGGADGYTPRPLSFEGPLACIWARLRPDATGPDQMHLIHRDMVLGLRTRTLTLEGRTVELSAQEFVLTETFMCYPGQVLSREQLLSAVWGLNFDPGSNAVEVYVSYPRNKLGRQRVETMCSMDCQLI